jgi:hypothetical protein
LVASLYHENRIYPVWLYVGSNSVGTDTRIMSELITAVSCNTGFFMYSCEAKIKLAAVAFLWWSAKSKQDRVPFSCSRQQTGLLGATDQALGDSLGDRRGTFEIVR